MCEQGSKTCEGTHVGGIQLTRYSCTKCLGILWKAFVVISCFHNAYPIAPEKGTFYEQQRALRDWFCSEVPALLPADPVSASPALLSSHPSGSFVLAPSWLFRLSCSPAIPPRHPTLRTNLGKWTNLCPSSSNWNCGFETPFKNSPFPLNVVFFFFLQLFTKYYSKPVGSTFWIIPWIHLSFSAHQIWFSVF